MKFNPDSSVIEELDDASLVEASRDGDRQAFGKIVTRYQRLLCSLAYSSLGKLSESEDVAQEAFVEAWRKLGGLREPAKLKSWLCGILRFKISHHRRKEARQPVNHADELQETDVLESEEEAIDATAMREEEQALLWKALEGVPETYRETLILYYREHRSVEHVACELDLTEDAVKQRLSRGRKLLQEQMMKFVEGALTRSTPGRGFTAGVLAALGAAAPAAQAAGCGTAAAKVGSTFKWATIITFLASFSGLISSFFALRANLDQTRTRRERRAVVRTTLLFLGISLGFCLYIFGLRQLAVARQVGDVEWLALVAQGSVLVFVFAYVTMTGFLLKRMRRLRTSERARRPELFASDDDQFGAAKGEYRSKFTLFGFPLVHAKLAMAEENDEPAVAWIAAGDRAYGLLFAWGGFAIAPVSVGIVSFGLFTAGAVGMGFVGIGMIGLGVLSMGAMAIGYKAYAGLAALGWQSALSNGFSTAKEAAIGPIASASEINSELAASIVNVSAVNESHAIILGIMAVFVIVPVVCYARVVRRRLGRTTRGCVVSD